ncbi:hypothetical protein SNOG_15905 [Parastagonospora nodorum SN15]|uniref:Uncharacterized protein n=1 Tax=Phaeosphaeria nodorum (strain SN15 / ATCC MYA-4574 / FGSC 10173) TaxID=321614 RepID=Q0TX82_PHANO|nr:hypothetical protein SNOG_15905 [Parastagonospora nodorum SN15]EAT76743.1 hypothetical protein SNOG_15905 [Parastagonospora nodorum SN15]
MVLNSETEPSMSAYQQLPKEKDTEEELDNQKPEIAANCLEIFTELPPGDGVGSEWNESDLEISEHEPLLFEN